MSVGMDGRQLVCAAEEFIELTQTEQLAIRARLFTESMDSLESQCAHAAMKCGQAVKRIERFFRRYPHLRRKDGEA